MKLKLFFSYGRRESDQEYANLLVNYLNKIPSTELFWDKFLYVGEPWKETLLTKAKEADVFVYLVSEHSVRPQSFCIEELNAYRKPYREAPTIIPIILEPYDNDSELCKFLKSFHALPQYNSKLSTLKKLWSDEDTRNKTCNKIKAAIQKKVDKLINEQKQSNSLEQEVDNWGFNLSFEHILSEYLSEFDQKFDALEPFEYNRTYFSYYLEEKQIAFLPCFYNETKGEFTVEENLVGAYEYIGEKLPLLYLLPTNIWQQDSEDNFVLKFPKHELEDTISDLELRLKRDPGGEKIHIVSLNFIEHALDS